MRVRLAVPQDAESIARVHVQGWRETYEGLMPNDFLDSLSFTKRLSLWTEVLARPGQSGLTCVSLDDAGQICGFAYLGIARDDIFAGIPELYSIYILRANQRQGLGLDMLACLAAAGQSYGHTSSQFYAWVLKKSSSVRWYQKIGGHKLHQKTTIIGGLPLIEDAYTIPWPKVVLVKGPSAMQRITYRSRVADKVGLPKS